MSNLIARQINNVQNIRQKAKAELYQLNPALEKLSLSDIRRVLVFNASPRSGSSLLYFLLSRSSLFYSLIGEAIPFYKLNIPDFFVCELAGEKLHHTVGLNSKALLENDFVCDAFNHNQLLDICHNPKERKEYFINLILRLALQWPSIQFEYDHLFNLICSAFENHQKKHHFFSLSYFYIELFRALMAPYPSINPYYYDFDKTLIQNEFPMLPVSIGPPSQDILIEEPPFVLLPPHRHITQEDFSDKVLLLKSSTDVYRIDFVKSLFPNAEIKYLTLTRNPAGVINGLYDGWLYPGFYSYNLNYSSKQTGFTQLNIPNYSNCGSFGKNWWNFDLPPGWINYVDKTLYEISAFQWHASMQEIYQLIKKTKDKQNTCIVTYENIIRDYISRVNEIKKVFQLLDVNFDDYFTLHNMPIVQATTKPKPYRWKKREKEIIEVLNGDLLEMAKNFNYCLSKQIEWL